MNDDIDDEMQSLLRATYMRREYATLQNLAADFQGLVFAPHQLSRCGDDVWRGIIFIRSRKSPWFRGAFSFTVVFPFHYPQECPVATFDVPLLSHPLLKADHRTVPFELEYLSIGKNQVSVMLRLLTFIRSIFTEEQLRAVERDIDRGLCARDVELCSVTTADAVAQSYVTLLTDEMREWLLESQYALSPDATEDERRHSLRNRISSFAAAFTSRLVPKLYASGGR